MPSHSYGRGGGGNMKKKAQPKPVSEGTTNAGSGAKAINGPRSASLQASDEYSDMKNKASVLQRISRVIPSGQPKAHKYKRGLTIDDFPLHPPLSAPSVMVTHPAEAQAPHTHSNDKINYVTTIINNTTANGNAKPPTQPKPVSTPSTPSRLSISTIRVKGAGANEKALSDTDADSFILNIKRNPSVRRMTVNGFLIPADDASSTDDRRSSIDATSLIDRSRNGSRVSIDGETTAVEHTDGKEELPSSPEHEKGVEEDEDPSKGNLYNRRTGRARSLSVDVRPKIRFGPTHQLRPVKSILISREKENMLDVDHNSLVHTDPESPLPGRESFTLERTRSYILASQTLANTRANTLRSAFSSSSDTDTTATISTSRTPSTPSLPQSSLPQSAAPEDPLRNLILGGVASLAFLVLLSAGKEVLYLIALLPILLAFAKHYPEIQKTLAPLMK